MQLRLKLMRFNMLVRLALESGLSRGLGLKKSENRGDWQQGA
jgi:hypothetical protein